MSDTQRINEVSVDRRDETVVTRQPGYTATEQFTRDVAAERRLRSVLINRIIWAILVLLEVLLGLRFVLKLIAANADSGFAVLIYGITRPFIAPFALLVGTPTSGGITLEVTTLIAMGIYALLFWGVVTVIRIVMDRPSARSATRSVREEMPADPGNARVVHTTTRS